jgi:hypothetical protein
MERPGSLPSILSSTPVHLCFWALVMPSGWRQALDQIDPSLPVDFSLLTLTKSQWKNPLLRALLLQNFILLIAINAATTGLILTLMGEPNAHISQSVFLTVGYTAVITLFMACALNFNSAVLFGGIIGLGIGLLGRETDLFYLPMAIAGGLTGSSLIMQSYRLPKRFNGHRIGGLATGLAASAFLIFVVHQLVTGNLFGLQVGNPGTIPLPHLRAGIIAPAAGLIFTILGSIALAMRTSRGFARMLPIGLIGGLIIGAAYYFFLTAVENSPTFLLAAGVSGGMLMSFIYTATWTLTATLGGPLAGAIAAGLVFPVGWAYLAQYLVLGRPDSASAIPITVVIAVASLSFSLWRPILLLPLTMVWNNLMYSIDLRSSKHSISHFKLHSAFWDEGLFFAWPGFEDYLLLQAEHDSQGFERSKIKFADSAQRKPLQAAMIELIARNLETCTDVRSIAQVSPRLEGRYLDNQIAGLLRSFSKTSQDVESALKQSSAYRVRLSLGRIRDDLNLFQRELILSPQKYTVRFSRTISIWNEIIENELLHLTDAAELQNEIDNPYICGMPLASQQEVFVGRTDIMARLEQLLVDPGHPPVHLYGQRRMGKTSLLLNLDHYLPGNVVSVFLDGQCLAGYPSADGLIQHFIQAVLREANLQRGLDLPALTALDSGSNYFLLMNQWIDQTEQILAQSGTILLLMIDEFEALERILLDHRSAAEFLGLARFVVQHRQHFKILLVGSHSLDEIGGWSLFLTAAQVIKVGRLGNEDTMQLIEHPVKDFQLQYEPSASRHILFLTRGHPHLVQSVCYELVALKNEQEVGQRFLVKIEDVEAAASRALDSGSFFFADVRNAQLTPGATAMLDYLASLGATGEITSAEWRQRFPDRFEENMALAIKRDLIEEINGSYRFQVEMMRRWFTYRPF